MRFLPFVPLLLLSIATMAIRFDAAGAQSTASAEQEAEDELVQQLIESTGLVKALTRQFWKTISSPKALLKAVPNLATFVPNLLGGVVTNILELVIDSTRKFVNWIKPSSRIEFSARTLQESFLGRLLHWDALDSGLRVLQVPTNCRSRAACECGAYVLHRNTRVAKFLKALRAYLGGISAHWPALMRGLRGDVCEDVYRTCTKSFIMATTRTRQSRARKQTS